MPPTPLVGQGRRDNPRIGRRDRADGRARSHDAHQRQRQGRRQHQRLAADRRQHPRRACRRRDGARRSGAERCRPACTLSKTYDLAEFVATAIANVRDAILIGGLLAVIVLLVFLRDWRLTLVASVTLPLTVMTTFLVMRWLGETINVMSMGGLAVAIGLVIDDAVVVVENIYRHLDSRRGAGEAVRARDARADGAGRRLDADDGRGLRAARACCRASSVNSSSALSMTLSAAVLISLVQALTLIPLLARWAARRPRGERRSPGHTAAALERVYSRTLDSTMRRPRRSASLSRWCWPRAARALFADGQRLSARSGRRRLRHRLPVARRQRARGDRSHAAARSKACCSRRRTSPRSRGGPDPSWACSRRSRTRATSWSGSSRAAIERAGGRGDQRSARQADDEAVPQLEIEFVQLLQDMIGDLEGQPTPIEVKVFGDDPDVLAGPRRAGRTFARGGFRAWSTSSASSAGTRRRHGISIRRRRDAWAERGRRYGSSSPTHGSATFAPSCA